MEETMNDDFIEEDFLDEEEGASGSNRPFLIAIGALVTVFVIAGACTLIFFLQGRSSANQIAEATAIAATNDEIAVTNTAVAVFISQTETAQAQPTDTTEPTATSTATSAVSTPTPTNTPVVAEGEATIIGAEETETTDELETGTAEAGVTAGAATVEADGTSVPTPIAAASTIDTETSDAEAGTLPQTGFDTWGIIVIGLVFIATLVVARRLRTG
jgi:LPXTG-motif cell wall-anchored protein